MAKSSEEISRYNTTGGKTDSNLANDALHLGGVPADEFATEKYVQDYHNAKEELLKEYIDEQDASKLQQAKSYTDVVVQNQDFSAFAKVTDVQALDDKLSDEITEGLNTQKNYTDGKVSALARDVNENFEDVGQSITALNNTTRELFTSVSNGKSNVAAAITDQGVSTASNASFDTMATNIRKIPTGGGEPDPYYINTGDGTAGTDDIMLGKTAYVKGEKVYGSHVDTGRDTSDATATPYDILVGKTAYVQDQKITGILDMSGETPTYSSPDGVEKIYGGNSRDYTINSIPNNGNNIDAVLYNSRTEELVAGICASLPDLYVKYFYNNAIVMTKTLDLSTVIANIETTLRNYSDYDVSDTITHNFIGVTDLNIYKPLIALYSATGMKKEAVVTLLPLIEVHTPQNGATVVTWEIDTSNIVYYPITNITNYTPRYYMTYIKGDGTQIIVLGEGIDFNGQETRTSSSFILNLDNENFSIDSCQESVFPAKYRGATGIREFIPIASKNVIVVRMYLYGVVAIFLDNANSIVQMQTLFNSIFGAVSEDLRYAIDINGNCYRLGIDLENNAITKYLIGTSIIEKPTNAPTLEYYGNCCPQIIGNDKLYITNNSTNTGEGNNFIYSFDPNDSQNPLKLLDSGKYNILGKINKVTDAVLFCNYNSALRYLKLVQEYEELIALKYNGEYYYPIKGGVMTAGQGDVRAGKTFIGWMGYEETGTMEVE